MFFRVQIGHDYGDSDDVVEARESDIAVSLRMSYDVEERSRMRHHVGPADERGIKPVTISELTFESNGGS